jgi:hypothetical protein
MGLPKFINSEDWEDKPYYYEELFESQRKEQAKLFPPDFHKLRYDLIEIPKMKNIIDDDRFWERIEKITI